MKRFSERLGNFRKKHAYGIGLFYFWGSVIVVLIFLFLKLRHYF